MKKSIRLLVLVAVLALVAGACGADEPASSPGTSDQSTTLATNPDPTDPDITATCPVGVPDCNDTPGGVPTDLPPSTDTDLPAPSSPDALSVSDARAATGQVTIAGALFIDSSGARLCEALAESFPPQCGGASIAIVDYEELLDVPTITEQGITWTDQVVSFPGEIVDGVFLVDPTVTG